VAAAQDRLPVALPERDSSLLSQAPAQLAPVFRDCAGLPSNVA